jgi:DnaJ-class molecular chaperone
MTVPKWSNTGAVLRLKGKGVARAGGGKGDELVALKIVLPEKPDAELESFIAKWGDAGAYNPRQVPPI